MAIKDKQVKFSFLIEYHLIVEDFDKILGFIDPSDENLEVFSHRIYELLLRTCTAVETVSKRVLVEQGYILPDKKKRMDIKDYFTLSSKHRLSEYLVLFTSWRSGTKKLNPFSTWNCLTYAPLPWYQAYNKAKHDRDMNFKYANLENLINAIAGLFVLLYSQFGEDVFGKYQSTVMTQSDDDEVDFIYANDSIFSIKEPIKLS